MAGEIEEPFRFNFQADLLHCGSISFGRFESESLSCERRLSFSHNRYLEEVEKYSKPGSVTEKKAHFRRKALLKQSSSECQDGGEFRINEIDDDPHDLEESENGNESKHLTCFDKSPHKYDEETEVQKYEQEDFERLYAENGNERSHVRSFHESPRSLGYDEDGTIQESEREKVRFLSVAPKDTEHFELEETHQSGIENVVLVKSEENTRGNLNDMVVMVDVASEEANDSSLTSHTADKEDDTANSGPQQMFSSKARPTSEIKGTKPKLKTHYNGSAKAKTRESEGLLMKEKEKKSTHPPSPITRSVRKASKPEESSMTFSKAKVLPPKKSIMKEYRSEKTIEARSSVLEKSHPVANQNANRTKQNISPHINQGAAGFSFKSDQRAERRKEEKRAAEMTQTRKSLNFKATPMPSFYNESARSSDRNTAPVRNIMQLCKSKSLSIVFGQHMITKSEILIDAGCASRRFDFPIKIYPRFLISPAMKEPCRRLANSLSPVIIFIFLVLIHIALVGADAFDTSTVQREINGRWPLFDCPQCTENKEQVHAKSMAVGNHVEKDIDIIVTYIDTCGAIRIRTVKSKDLSASWVWKTPIDDKLGKEEDSKPQKDEPETRVEDSNEHSAYEHADVNQQPHKMSPVHPAKLKRRALRQERRDSRTAQLIQEDKMRDTQMQAAAIERAKTFDTSVKAKYSIWRKEYESPNSDSTVKLMHDQIIMAKAYASIAKAKNAAGIYDSLIKQSKRSQKAIGEATYDSELGPSAVDRAKEMGHILSLAKDQFYDCIVMARKLRVMLQSREANVEEVKKKSASLTQVAAKTIPRPLHCLPLVLTTDYFMLSDEEKKKTNTNPNSRNIEDPSLYHYAIFSDNVLATSVVVNSTVVHAKEPRKHVFHIVTDKLNFAAMKMWFLVNSPEGGPTIQVENVDDFTWLNASYCPVLRQLETSQMREYYFKAHQASSVENLKYRNPKYLSMLNHLRFYLPEVYPKLDKILFLDDDIVIQKDLTPLWSVNMGGMVNGAVETCKESFHRFDKYLNFSNPKISDNFSPDACGWAFGMNMFDLKEWRKRDITGIYHAWQNMNEDRSLWKLGTLPPGLITFYNLTHPLERKWHVLGLGYDPALNQTEIENAAVVHYNGNYKPWLDLAIAKYKSYWSKHVKFDNPYLQLCNFNTFILSS